MEEMQKKMAELRMTCEEVEIQTQLAKSLSDSFRQSVQSIEAKAKDTAANQEKLGKLKDYLRGLEGDLAKSIAVRTRKGANHVALTEALSSAKARTEERKKIVQDQREMKDKYASIVSQQLLDFARLEVKINQDVNHTKDLEEAISWYNRVLGFRIEGGHGVKFIFNKIDLKNPSEEFSFTIRHENDIYTLLDCDPYLDGTKELVEELNQTNGLFKFVRIMRERFQAASSIGIIHQAAYHHPDTCTATISAPPSSISANKTESLTTQNELQVPPRLELDRPTKKVNHGLARKPATPTSGSASSVRRSPRFKVKK